jgi:hypothetical protein
MFLILVKNVYDREKLLCALWTVRIYDIPTTLVVIFYNIFGILLLNIVSFVAVQVRGGVLREC